MGESVEAYARRFKKAAKRTGNTIPEVGKAMAFIQGLLPAIYPMAILGGRRNTLDRAIESAKTGEMSAMGYARQVLPEQILNNTIDFNRDNRIYQDMKREKGKDDIDDLADQLCKKMEIRMLQQDNRGNYQRSNGNYQRNNRNYQRNNGNYQGNRDRRCYECNELGHIRPNCPNINRTQDSRSTGRNNRKNNEKNDESRRTNVKEYRLFDSLNYNRASEEKENAHDTDYSSENEYEMYEMTTRSGKKVRSESQKEQDMRRAQKARETRKSKNICTICETAGHFATECMNERCEKCAEMGKPDETGHLTKNCPYLTEIGRAHV